MLSALASQDPDEHGYVLGGKSRSKLFHTMYISIVNIINADRFRSIDLPFSNLKSTVLLDDVRQTAAVPGARASGSLRIT